MSRLQNQIILAPSGMDVTSDPVFMDLGRARYLVNCQVDRPGKVRTNTRLVDTLPTPQMVPIQGVSWYYQATIQNNVTTGIFNTDLEVWVEGGFLFIATPSTDPLNVPSSNVSPQINGITGYSLGSPFFSTGRVRFAALADELIMVQDGGILPLRFYAGKPFGEGFWRAGLQPPLSVATATTGPNLSVAVVSITGGIGPGEWGYKLTFADERDRESSPTEVLNITIGSNQAVAATYDNDFPTPPVNFTGADHIVFAHLYRNTAGAPDVFYRIATAEVSTTLGAVVFPAGSYLFDNNPYDDAPDVDIVGGQIAPNPGENDPPNPASVIAIHNNRVFLNDTTNNNVLQISDTLSTTQYTIIPSTPVTVTDGVRTAIGTDQGDPITALVEFGSYLAIFKRRGCFFLAGDNLSDFIIRAIHSRGCIAPDSAVRCNNIVMFLSDDGVYAASYGDEAGDIVTKVSKEIEKELYEDGSARFTEADRENSQGWFVDNRYHLAVRDIIFVWDFDAQGWITYVFGNGLLQSPGAGIPDVQVFAGVNFSLLPDSGREGQAPPVEPDCGNDMQGPCDVVVNPLLISATADGGTFFVTLMPTNSTVTPYASNAAWLSINGPPTGAGVATVIVAPNSACAERVGTVTICSAVVEVDQAGIDDPSCCDVSVSPTSFPDLTSDGSTQTINVTYNNANIVQPQTNFSWLHPSQFQPDAPGSLTGIVEVLVDPAPPCTARTGTVTICDATVTFTQPFSVVFTPSALMVSKSTTSASTTLSGDNWQNNNPPGFMISPSGLGATITQFPTLADPTLTIGFPANITNIVQVWTVTTCSGAQFVVTQGVSCFGATGTTPNGIVVSSSPVPEPVTFGPITMPITSSNNPFGGGWVPTPGSPDFAMAEWSFTIPVGGFTSVVITTPLGNSVTFNMGSPNLNFTPAQLAEYSAFNRASAGPWNCTMSGVAWFFANPADSRISLGLSAQC